MRVRRVAITTATDRAPDLADTVRKHGLEPVSLPCIEVVPAPDHLLSGGRADASRADWILVTSARAINALWPNGDMPHVPVAAVGSSTAKAVAQAGGRVATVGDAGAAALGAKLSERVTGKSVFFPHAAGAEPTTVETLSGAGAKVSALPVYEALPMAPGPDPVDAAVFGSPSAVSGWCRARNLDDLVLAAIGETTKAALVERGHRPDVVPPRPEFDLLMSLLAVHLRERSPV